jgi:hypothetical protein
MKTMNLKRQSLVRALKVNFDASLYLQPILDARPNLKSWPLGHDCLDWSRGFGLKLILLFFSVAFSACQKEQVQDTVIEGRITEVGTFEPVRVEGLRLGLFRHERNGFFPSGSTKLAEFTTDEKGSFYHTLKLERDFRSYYIELLESPSGYFAIDRIRYLNSNSLNFIQLNMNREAWLKLILNNEGGGEFDYFVFAINGTGYSHTGGGKPSVIQRVPSLDTCHIIFSDYRTNPVTNTLFRPVVMPNDTLEFEIDL